MYINDYLYLMDRYLFYTFYFTLCMVSTRNYFFIKSNFGIKLQYM